MIFKIALVAKLLIDLGSIAGFKTSPPMMFLFFGFAICDAATLWMRYV